MWESITYGLIAFVCGLFTIGIFFLIRPRTKSSQTKRSLQEIEYELILSMSTNPDFSENQIIDKAKSLSKKIYDNQNSKTPPVLDIEGLKKGLTRAESN
jgi:pentose-5-phosphate-3-epimerase